MALTVTSRGTGTHNTGATTLVPGGRSATLAVGSMGVLCISADNAGANGASLMAPASWTDAKGNTWTLRTNALYDNGAASAGVEMMFYTAPITVALLTTDLGTITWAGGVSPVAKVWTWYEVIPGVGNTVAYSTGGNIAGATAANAQVVTASVLVGDAVIAGYFSENVGAVTGDSDSTNGTWTAQQTATIGATTSGVRIATQQKVQTTTASTQSYDATVASQDRIAGYIMLHEVVNTVAAPTALSLTFTGDTPTVTATNNVLALPTALALAWTGATPTVAVTEHQFAAPTALALTWTGDTPVVLNPQSAAPTELALILTGDTPAVSTPVAAAPSSLSLALSGATPDVATPVAAVPDALALAWTGDTPEVVAPVHQTPTALALAWTGAVPDVAAGSDADVTAEPTPLDLALALGTPAVSVTANVSARPTALGLGLTFATPTVAVTQNKLAVPSPLQLRWRGAKPVVDSGLVETKPFISALQFANERKVRPRLSAPKAMALGMRWATPEVRVGDDFDVLTLVAGL